MKSSVVISLVLGTTLLALAPVSTGGASDDAALATEIAQGLIAACPPADPGDEVARDRSAEQLASFTRLRDVLSDPIFWGGLVPNRGYDPGGQKTTLFNPFVWRKMYLSLFTFPGDFRIERADPYTVLHLPCGFRNRLDPGAYPYPFWHSAAKWTSYQRSVELLLLINGGKIVGGYRSDVQDPSRPFIDRKWDGKWQWADASGQELPFDSLYRWLFLPGNPHVVQLEADYKAFALAARSQACASCHSPNNRVKMSFLVLMNLPNQALTSRHQIVRALEQNAMPAVASGAPLGIADGAERQRLIALAEAFAATGDRALAYEQESTLGGRGPSEVTLNDAVLALQAAVGVFTPPPAQKAAYDLDRDGQVDVRDAVLLLRTTLGLDAPP